MLTLRNPSVFAAVQTKLGDRFTPFLSTPSTLSTVSRNLTDLLSQQTSPSIVTIGLTASHSWLEIAPYYEALARAGHSIYLIASETFYTSSSNLYSCQQPLDSKLPQEQFLLILSPEFSLVLVGQVLSSPQMTGDVSQLMTFCSYEPEAIAAAADLLISIVAESLPQQAEVLRKALAQSPPHEPTARAASQVLPCLLQLLDASAQQHLQLQRKVQVMEELQQLNEELKRSLKFKDEFVSNVSQQLCTPLANIKTAIQLLQSPRIKDAQKSKYWNVLSSECDHQINLIDSLTELSGIEQPAREPEEHSIVLFDIVPGVVSTYQAVAHERGLMLAYTIPANLPSANFPAPALKQVLVKLIENGIQCTPAGGQIWVTATADSHYVQMEVRDTGIGIPQESLPKIFDRFYRVPRSKMEMTGVGLGLTIVQKLLLQHGGAISVRSQPGQGSTFTVLLPQVLLEKQS